MMRIACMLFCFALAGCMSGTVLRSGAHHPVGASFVYASPLTVIRIAPLHHPSRATELQRGKPTSQWVTAGWYMVTGFYPVSTDGLIKAENSRSRRATLRRMRGLWNRSR